MVCDAEKCLPPEYVDLNFKVPASGTTSQEMPEETGDASQDIKEAESTNKVDTDAMVDIILEHAHIIWTAIQECVGVNPEMFWRQSKDVLGSCLRCSGSL